MGTLRGQAAIAGVTDAVSPTGQLDLTGRALEARMVKEVLEADQKAEAGWAESWPRLATQRTLPRMNSMKVPVGTPVGPFGMVTRSVSE